MITRRTWLGMAALGVLQSLGPRPLFDRTACAAVPAPATTTVSEVVMYGIDSSNYELLRYVFDKDEFVRIGVVVDQNGVVVQDCEAMTFIPSGPNKGLYAGANFYQASPSRLIRINGMDASCYKYPVNIGFNKVEGMTAIKDAAGNWYLLAVSKHQSPGDNKHSLIAIDPATGIGSLIMETDERYDGLALSPPGTPAGTIYGWARDDGLWVINPTLGTETRRPGNAPFDRVDTLEWAWGDNLPTIDCTPVAPAAWTANGVLFGFDDDSNALLILDPVTGNAVTYPSSFVTIDCEGLAFTTQRRDPYGNIVYDPHD